MLLMICLWNFKGGMMNKIKIKKVQIEITRLIARIHVLEEALSPYVGVSCLWHAPKECGAVKRASMDLTKALAEMRKPG